MNSSEEVKDKLNEILNINFQEKEKPGINVVFDKVYVLDTNIILEDANNLFHLSKNNLIVLPEVVIDELDSKKSGFGEINYQAREFGRILSDADNLGITEYNDLKILMLGLNKQEDGSYNTRIDIVQLNSKSQGNSISDNDKRIIEIAKKAEDYYGVLTLLSNDVMCRTRALMDGLASTCLRGNAENINPEFIKFIEVNDVENLDGSCITDFDEEHSQINYCYHFKAQDGNQKIGYIIDNKINIIEDDDFDEMAIQPLNLGQRFACAGMLDPRVDIAVVEAKAGSGKTLLAIATGMKLVDDKQYDKIIYIRNSVESVDKAEEVGFLPGLESKFEIYNFPLHDTLEFISQNEVQTFLRTGKQPQTKSYSPEQLKEKYKIETMWNGAIRGRTLSRAFVIIDEAQNFSKKSLQTVVTRLDKDCKLVLIGSNRQIDHPYITKLTNGLSVILNSMDSPENEVTLFGTELNKVVRGKITAYAERLFET